MEDDKKTLEKAKDLIEVSGKFVLALLALFYVTGLFVVNVYYSRYGVYSLSLFRLNYVLAGFWTLFPVILGVLFNTIVFLLAYSVVPYFRKAIRIAFRKPITKRSIGLKAALASLATFFTLAVCLFLFIWIIGNDVFAKVDIGVLPGLKRLVSLWTQVILYLAVIAFLFIRLAKPNPVLLTPIIYSLLTLFLLVAIGYISLVGSRLYGVIPPHLGGGATKDVQLLLDVDDSAKRYFELSGLQFYENTNQTKTAQLLFATEEEYVFLVKPPEWKTPSTLSIKRDMVKSVLYEGLLGGGSDSSFGKDDELNQPTPPPTPSPQASPSGPTSSPSPQP